MTNPTPELQDRRDSIHPLVKGRGNVRMIRRVTRLKRDHNGIGFCYILVDGCNRKSHLQCLCVPQGNRKVVLAGY